MRVCLYLRMSSDEQKLSIEQQREELLAFCLSLGYDIVCEYIDSGESGSKNVAKRKAYWKMIEDAISKKFECIVCYCSARFGRLDIFDSANEAGVGRLKKSGIKLHTKIESKLFDWDNPADQMYWTMLCQANKSYSTSLSHTSLRGRQHYANQGYWVAGMVPFGYDKKVSDGKETIIVNRNSRHNKGKHWHVNLVENAEDGKIVKHIFNEFKQRELSYGHLANELNKKGIQSGGKRWTGEIIKKILTDTVYVGDVTYGSKSKKVEKFNSAKQVERKAVVPVIIEKDLFKSVQLKIARRKDKRTKPQTMRCGLLSGYLVCDHCGKRLCKREQNGRVIYNCNYGVKNRGTCPLGQIEELETAQFIIDYLLMNVHGNLVEMLQQQKPVKDSEDVIKKRISLLKKQIEDASESALLAPANRREWCWKRVEELTTELSEVERQLIGVIGDPTDYLDWWEDVCCELRDAASYGEAITNQVVNKREQLRSLFSDIDLKVRVRWVAGDKRSATGKGRRLKWIVDKRLISLRVAPLPTVEQVQEEVSWHTPMGNDILTIRFC